MEETRKDEGIKRRGSGAKSLLAAMLTVFLWGGITAGPSVAGTSTFTDMGYTLIDLGTLGGSGSWASAINDKGQVIGGSLLAGDLTSHAFLYSDGIKTNLTQMVFDLFLVDKF